MHEEWIYRMRGLNILVVGETIIDEYQYGNVLGKSGKSLSLTFQNEHKEQYDGGVRAIRNHLKEFCNRVDIMRWSYHINKKRYIQDKQKLFETYTYETICDSADSINSNLEPIEFYDLILVADFGHGFLTEDLIEDIEYRANYLALNTQNNSGNMGMNTINKYARWDYASIDELELRLAYSNQFDEIKDILRKKFGGTKKIVSITENKNGSYVFKGDTIIHTPAYAKDIVDTVGAGDAYLALTSPLAYLDAPAEVIGYIGNLAGAIACSYPGNKEYVTKEKLLNAMQSQM